MHVDDILNEQNQTAETSAITIQPDYTEQLQQINLKLDYIIGITIVVIGVVFTNYLIQKIIFARA